MIKGLVRPSYIAFSHLMGKATKAFYPHFPYGPGRLTILPTTKCNLSCDFCSVKESLNAPEPGVLSLDEWKRVIDSIPIYTAVDFSGGEVFFAKNFIEMLEYFFQKPRASSIITNGSTLTKPIVEKFIDFKLPMFLVSLDGMASYHDRIRGKAGVFERATEMLGHMIEEKKRRKVSFPITCIKTVLTEDNADQIPQLLEFAERLGVDQIQFAIMYHNRLQMSFVTFKEFERPELIEGNSYAYPASVIPSILNAVEQIFEFKKKSKMYVGMAPEMKTKEEVLQFIKDPKSIGVKSCGRPFTDLFLHGDGQLTGCISHDFGNIRDFDYDVQKTLKGPAAMAWLEHFKKQEDYYPVCEGCCRAVHTVKPK
ncbi:MAG: radical SAM protein [Halobacteriovoraceae bacterium]|jgi:MoaA/NifB/PqqE/SkfB family radical SAM enzyme|nr:radical SAM protein [Halobacteriovoraceae bacterium]MBT5095890.1 radical SAM protein [Halobacteriovoraceae bacterium]